MWVAVVDQRLVWALLPMTSPGRTGLILTPPTLFTGTPPTAVKMLADAVCERWHGQGVQLAQFLLPPDESSLLEAYQSCGFEVLAELFYLQRTVGSPVEVALPDGLKLHNYNTSTHASFAQAIVRSYEGSFDCPSLNGRRHIDDVIAGHKGTGLFDPSAWHLVTEHTEPRGVLILSPAQHNEVIELVYLGLTPESRGKGLGNALMRLAFNETTRLQRRELSLAVDSRNTPALKLYFRHGLRRVGSRLALLRDLRTAAPISR
jgi:GNAT superfamily N-acetyltransferase